MNEGRDKHTKKKRKEETERETEVQMSGQRRPVGIHVKHGA